MHLSETEAAAPTRIGSRTQIAAWLFVCCAFVFAMVVLGGVTRLTDSGLSIVEWAPVRGIVPPLDSGDWEAAFADYRATPEYQTVNRGMTLDEFRQIYWIEFTHRAVGRATGLVFLVPFAYFLVARKIERRLAVRLGAIFVLGAAQGGLGWFMVQSGLGERADVNPLRLAAHLGLAVVILGALLWYALGFLAGTAGRDGAAAPGIRPRAAILLGLSFATVIAGGLVAGTDAGLVYNTFPLMNGRLVPAEVFAGGAWWDNPAAVQLAHRGLALLTTLAVAALWLYGRRLALAGPLRVALHAVLAAAAAQIALGVLTLVNAVPLALGIAHQAGAMVLISTTVVVLHRAR